MQVQAYDRGFGWKSLVGLTLALAVTTAARAQSAPRERISIDQDWRFTKGDPADAGGKLSYATMRPWMMASGGQFAVDGGAAPAARPAGNVGEDVAYTRPDFGDGAWRKLDLPHDWGIEGPFAMELPGGTGKLPYFGVGWYRKTLEIPAGDAGKQVYLDIDGAMSYANVWCNGQYAGGWPYGYSSFRVDLTPYVRPGGANTIAIRLDNPNGSSRWYPGGGIYRNVWLVKTSPVHVAQYGTYLTTPGATAASAPIDLKVSVGNESKAEANVRVRTEIFELGRDDRRGATAAATLPPVSLKVAAGTIGTVATTGAVANPKLWSPKAPNRYVAVTTVEQDGRAVDSYETPFGVRTLTFDPMKGLLVNGEHVRLNGVCLHSDLGALGMAVNTRALARQIEILQEMGGNAIRTSHNFPSPDLLELCDKMGMMVIDEAFDCWQGGKTQNGYHQLFADWSEKDLRANTRRDRNHPSVIMWSTGNEVGELGSRDGHLVSARLARIVKEEDPTRPVTVGSHTNSAGYNEFVKTVDAWGWNYLRPQATNFDMYKTFRAANPDKFVFSSEAASTLSSRGYYLFPFTSEKGSGFSPADQQMSSYDLYAPGWATPPDWEWHAQDHAGFVVGGEFVWTGFDYLGEPTTTGPGGGGPGTVPLRGGRRGAPATGPAPGPGAQADAPQDVFVAAPPAGPRGGAGAAPGGRRGPGGGGAANPRRSSYFGIIDLAGFPKDRFYLYQSRWRPDMPMAHILPHWNWQERVGQVTPVHVYTSGDEGELFLNGKSLGRRKKGEKGMVNLQTVQGGPPMWRTDEYRLMWDDVVYEPGELKVVTYKGGKEWATQTMKTTGPASKLGLKPDRADIAADGKDLSFVTVSVNDAADAMVPRSMNLVRFEISGPGEIVAVDNGDASSLEPFHASQMKAFNGLALVIVRAKPGQAGAITLRAAADGLQGAEVAIRSK
jgi:beta-galactosidase